MRRENSTGTFTPSGLVFVVTIAMFLSGVFASRYEKAIQRTREITRSMDCQAFRRSVLENGMTPQVDNELTHGAYFPEVPADSITIEDVSHLYCGDADMHMDPVQTIPGVRNQYANSTDKMPGSRQSVER